MQRRERKGRKLWTTGADQGGVMDRRELLSGAATMAVADAAAASGTAIAADVDECVKTRAKLM